MLAPPYLAFQMLAYFAAEGLVRLEALRGQPSAPPCLVLTTFDDAEAFLGAVRAGARGYLLEDASSSELGDAIRCVAGGGTWLKPSVTDNVLRALGEDRPREEQEKLTGREVEVLRLLGRRRLQLSNGFC